MVLVVLFLGAILVMQKQIARVFYGRWQSMGDGFAHGQQYDPQKTLECRRYVSYNDEGEVTLDLWYSQVCYTCCMDKDSTSDCTAEGFNGSIQGVTADQCRTNNPMIPYGAGDRWCCATACETNECKD